MAEDLDQVERSLKRAPRRAVADEDLLSTGSTLFNLGLSGRPHGGLAAGHYYYFVGDSSSGKTYVTATILAEACLNPRFKKHRLIYIDREDGSKMITAARFGAALMKRLERWSEWDRVKPPETTEEFYDRVESLQSKDQPFIGVLDTDNSLPCRAELDFLKAGRAARQKGAAEAKEYKTKKAVVHSERLRTVVNRLARTGSILIIIGQTRDRIGPGALYDPRTRSGGHALTYYATLEVWTSVGGQLKKSVSRPGKDAVELQNGIVVKAKIKKTRLTGRVRTVLLPLYWDSGLDDLGGCVDFLAGWGTWPRNDKGVITAPQFDLAGHRNDLVARIEGWGMEDELRVLTARVWNEIEQALVVPRKKRYV